MENAKKTYRVNTPTIVYEEIDGEAVIVNMENGSYYSLDDSGALVWSLLEKGKSVGQAIAVVTARYTGARDEIAAAVDKLISTLIDEELIMPDGESDNHADEEDAAAAVAGNSPFRAPMLRKYTDMEELLLLDPVLQQNGGDEPDSAPHREQ